MNALIKLLGDTYSTVQILLFRNLITVPAMLALLWVGGNFSALKTHRPLMHLLHATIGVVGMSCVIFSLGQLSLSQTVTTSYLAPLLITALSVPFLKEQVGLRRWSAVMTGFLGVLIMARPDVSIEPVMFVMLFGTFCFACIIIIRRKILQTESSVVTVLYFSSAGMFASGILMPWYWVAPNAVEWGLLIAMGTMATFSQLTLTLAVGAAPVSVTAPLIYSALIFAVAADILIWGKYPAVTTMVGAAVIIVAGLYVIYRESNISRNSMI